MPAADATMDKAKDAAAAATETGSGFVDKAKEVIKTEAEKAAK